MLPPSYNTPKIQQKMTKINKFDDKPTATMKVVVISTYPPFHDGIAQVVYHLFSEVSKSVDTTIIANRIDQRTVEHTGKLKILRLWSHSKLTSFFSIFCTCIKERANIVHIQFHPALYGGILQAVLLLSTIPLLRIFNKKVMVTMHTIRILSKTTLKDRIFIKIAIFFLAFFYNAVVVQTSSMRDVLIREYGIRQEKKIFVVPWGVRKVKIIDKNEAKRRLGLRDKFCVLNPSLLRKGVGVEEVIMALKTVRQCIPNVVYLIMGISPSVHRQGGVDLLRIKQLVKKESLGDVVFFLEAHEDLEDKASLWMSAADVLTYLHEDCPNEELSLGILDAVAYGKPVIVSDATKFKDITRELKDLGADSLVVSSKEREKRKCIANAMMALTTEKCMEGLIAKRFKELSEESGWNTSAQKMIKAYRHLTGKKA